MNPLSTQTKSFIILFVLVFFGTVVCLAMWSTWSGPGQQSQQQATLDNAQKQVLSQQTSQPQIDTSSWKTYTDKTYNFSFSYKPDWQILEPIKKSGYTILQVDPGKRYYNFKIYINPESFYILGGLPTTEETIDGQTALDVNGALFGIKANNLYYTFDIGQSMSLMPEFDAFVHSVKFSN